MVLISLLLATSMTMSPSVPQSSSTESSPTTSFDIVKYYNELLQADSQITPPIAAIESLISLLATTPLTTISETLALLSTHSTKLLSSQQNPIPLFAGTDLFQRYLVSSFQQRPSSLATSDFTALRHQIITNSSLFVKRANEARHKIAHQAAQFIRDDSTVITYGYSRVVHTLLTHAAEAGRYFNVLYVLPASGLSQTIQDSISELKRLSVPTTTIPIHALHFALASLPASSPPPQLVTGASAVLENGSIITQFGTHQIALTAKSVSIPLYVAAESYKFVRKFPLGCGQNDLAQLGVKQDVLRFETADSDTEAESRECGKSELKSAKTASPPCITNIDDMVEITPPDLISALFTETGIMTPDAVSEELIKLWF